MIKICADIRFVALDLDGTLLDDDKTIPAETIALIKEIQAGGVYVTLASSRPFCAVVPYARQLDISLPLIAHSGAYIADCTGQNIRLRQTLHPADSQAAIRNLTEYAYYIKVYCDDVLYVEKAIHETIAFSQTFGVEYREVGLGGLMALAEAPIRIAVIDQPRRIQAARQLLEPWDGSFAVSGDTPNGLEIVDSKVNKGRAVELLCSELGISQEQVMAIGNEGNDIEMIKAAGVGIAMGNACPELKQVASAITKANTHSGVAHALRQYILKR